MSTMSFEYQNPTKLVFAAGSITRLGDLTSAYGKKALLVTGGGSVKRNGTFDKATQSLKQAGVSYVECTDIEPNPRITSVARGAEIARQEGCDVVIALGGGSVMDASKVIAAAFYYDGDPWNLILHGQPDPVFPTRALPIITIPTIAATGSEMNSWAVISNDESKTKSFIGADCLFPKVALVDPELTVSVPADQTAYGVSDLITHVTESYFNGIDGTPIQDRFAEGVILTALEYGPRAVEDGSDLEAREQVQWAATVALNGWVQAGTLGASPVHMMEHVLSAHHDIAHGAGLAIVNPAWMRFASKSRPERFAQFANRVFGVEINAKNPTEAATAGIDKYVSFLKKIGCPTKLSEVGIDDSLFEQYAEDTVLVARDGHGNLPGRPPMNKEQIIEVLRSVI